MHCIQVCTYSWSEVNLEMRCEECERSQLLINPTFSESWALIGCNCGLVFIVTHVLYACVTPSKYNHCPVTLWGHFGVQKFISFRIFVKRVIQFLHLLLVTLLVMLKNDATALEKPVPLLKAERLGARFLNIRNQLYWQSTLKHFVTGWRQKTPQLNDIFH